MVFSGCKNVRWRKYSHTSVHSSTRPSGGRRQRNERGGEAMKTTMTYLLGRSPVGGKNVWEQSSKAAVDDSYRWGRVRLKTPWNHSHTPPDHLHTVFSLNDHCNLLMSSPCPVIPTLTSISSPRSRFESQVVQTVEGNKPRLQDLYSPTVQHECRSSKFYSTLVAALCSAVRNIDFNGNHQKRLTPTFYLLSDHWGHI